MRRVSFRIGDNPLGKNAYVALMNGKSAWQNLRLLTSPNQSIFGLQLFNRLTGIRVARK